MLPVLLVSAEETMKIMKQLTLIFLILLLLSVIVVSCGGTDRETEIAVIVALTQTAAAQQGAQSLPATEEPASNPLTEALSDINRMIWLLARR
jgi:hypothetical protein